MNIYQQNLTQADAAAADNADAAITRFRARYDDSTDEGLRGRLWRLWSRQEPHTGPTTLDQDLTAFAAWVDAQ